VSNPANLLNQNLAIGGNLAVAGDVVITGNENITGNVVTAGQIVSGTALKLVTPTLGTFSLDFTEVLVTLDTTSDTTAFSFGVGGLPVGALVVAGSIRVVTAITGIDSTLGTLNVNPTAGPNQAGSISTFTAGYTEGGIAPTGIPIVDADAGTFVLSGAGVDDVPSAGSIRVTLYFWRLTASTS
jgi:hypothetical protein